MFESDPKTHVTRRHGGSTENPLDRQTSPAKAVGGRSRRQFLGAGAALGSFLTINSRLGSVHATGQTRSAVAPSLDPGLAAWQKGPAGTSELVYFTPPERHTPNYHERQKPWELSAQEQREKGYDRETWNLEIVADPATLVDQPRTMAGGSVITFTDLLNAAKARVVRVPKCMTCLDIRTPFGSALWEGVPLRDLLWSTKPNGSKPIRRISCYAFQVGDTAKEQWCASLAPARVFEDLFGLPPVLLAYKFNGEPLTVRNGGPVRLIVPEAYGFKNIKHLRRIVLSNDCQLTDTYAIQGQDSESPMKTYVTKIIYPGNSAIIPSADTLIFRGHLQVGSAGLRAVQYAIVEQQGAPPPKDDLLLGLPWKDATIMPPPEDMATTVAGGLADAIGFERGPQAGSRLGVPNGAWRPTVWPIPYFVAYWAAPIGRLRPGRYTLYARSIDGQGGIQPMPRPAASFRQSGENWIASSTFTVA
jgi:DMSO/TMAO reductase YedYZ molybdopterin-dependent catalytic subunit